MNALNTIRSIEEESENEINSLQIIEFIASNTIESDRIYQN